jgi:hypothetical protein
MGTSSSHLTNNLKIPSEVFVRLSQNGSTKMVRDMPWPRPNTLELIKIPQLRPFPLVTNRGCFSGEQIMRH